MALFLGKIYIKLKADNPWLIDYHLVEANDHDAAVVKLKAFAEDEVVRWRNDKGTKNAELKGAVIQKKVI